MEADEKACPKCAETIKAAAVVCRFCGQSIGPDRAAEARKTGAKAVGGCLVVFIVIIALAVIFGKPDSKPAPKPAATTETAEVFTPAPPSQNYVEHRKDVYYYSSAVSEDAKKAGQAAENVVAFRYMGKNSDGDHVLQNADIPLKAVCSDPCRVIHLSTGETLAFNPDSVIGAAMEDAINGNLEISPRAKRH